MKTAGREASPLTLLREGRAASLRGKACRPGGWRCVLRGSEACALQRSSAPHGGVRRRWPWRPGRLLRRHRSRLMTSLGRLIRLASPTSRISASRSAPRSEARDFLRRVRQVRSAGVDSHETTTLPGRPCAAGTVSGDGSSDLDAARLRRFKIEPELARGVVSGVSALRHLARPRRRRRLCRSASRRACRPASGRLPSRRSASAIFDVLVGTEARRCGGRDRAARQSSRR